MFASLYRVMRDIGMPNPRDVDQLELWEIAVLIGADDYTPSEDDPIAQMRADMAYWQQRAGIEGEYEPTADDLEMLAALGNHGRR